VIHRDLKPSNILLDENGQPHVTDFGLAKVFEGDSGQTASGTIVGTPSYMSPEQAAGKTSEVSPRSDIYSLGAVLYEMLTGRPPFAETNPLDTLLQVMEATPDPLRKWNPHIPHELEAICLRCLEKSPDDRFHTVVELTTELDHFLKGEPVQLPTMSPVDRITRWARREPALASRLGVLSVAIVIVQLYYQLGGHDDLGRHLQVMGLLGMWTAMSFLFQRLLDHPAWARSVPHVGFVRNAFSTIGICLCRETDLNKPAVPVPYLWAVADAGCYTGLLYLADGPLGPVLIGYPVLVAGSGLWSEAKLVWFMTAVTTLSYSVLAVIRFEPGTPWHYPCLFAVALIGTGFIVSYQVHRLRSLTRHFERQRS